VSGNPELLGVLLRNLIDNAIRYSPPHTAVTLTTGTAGDGSWLEVADQGPGVPPSQRQRVLDRFYRMVGSGESGSGLGLSIVNRIAELHRANLELGEGAEGQGFRVRLRFTAGQSPEP
jgi:two-component system sensor histidine kinase QseC